MGEIGDGPRLRLGKPASDIAVWHAKDVWAWAIIPNRSGNEEKYLEPL